MTSPDKEDLRIQYQQCVENYRMLDRHIWQVPSVTILVASAIVGVAFGYLKDALIASSILLLFGVVLSFSMFVAVKKYRFFQYYTIERLREIEKELSLNHIPLVTNEYLFSVNKKFRDDLNEKKISDELGNIFKDKRYFLENPTIKVLTKDRKWEITDNEKKYSIKYIGNVLNIYIGRDGMNPRKWIERRRAGNWLALTVLFVSICLTGLLIFNIVRGLCN